MERGEAQLNRFLVEVFHDVMRLEEQELLKGPFKNLSVSEMHVIEAACDGQDKGSNSMAALAARLRVSAGTLTIAVKTLEQKGYLLRERSRSDRRPGAGDAHLAGAQGLRGAPAVPRAAGGRGGRAPLPCRNGRPCGRPLHPAPFF